MNKLATDVCILTETWFHNGVLINRMVEDFNSKSSYSFLQKDRQTRRGGGIAICYNKNLIQMTKAKIPPSKHEVYAAVGRQRDQRRKIVMAIYVPPWYNAQQNQSLFNYTNDALMALKSKYENPIILMGGDFNRRDAREATRDFPEVKIVNTGPTRGMATLDLILSNESGTLVDQGTV